MWQHNQAIFSANQLNYGHQSIDIFMEVFTSKFQNFFTKKKYILEEQNNPTPKDKMNERPVNRVDTVNSNYCRSQKTSQEHTAMLFLVQAGFIPLAYFKFIKIYINNLTPKGVNPKLDSLLHSVCHTKLPTSTEYSCLTGDTKKYKHNFYV